MKIEKLNENHLEYLIAKSEARLLRLEAMEAPEEIVQNELAHLNKLMQAKLDRKNIY